ncbi:hypothetical protein DTO012A8_10198 [Penicillium roqueforti]|nr:hypothetical protein DTO012A8_10198 [Penicillium roqueforti]
MWMKRILNTRPRNIESYCEILIGELFPSLLGSAVYDLWTSLVLAATTYGLRDDLHLVGQEYSWCVSIFYFGYLTGSFFSGRGLQYFHAGKFMGSFLGFSNHALFLDYCLCMS